MPRQHRLEERNIMSTEQAHDVVATPAPPSPLGGDPLVLGLPCFIVGSVALGLVLTTFVPAAAVGASLAILVAATGVGLLLSTAWAAALGQSAVAGVLGIFAGFWLSYSALVLGLTHNWFGVPAGNAVRTQELFLTAWLVLMVLLTLATLRLPSAYTLLFALVALALLLVLLATVNSSTGLQKTAGVVVFAFAAVGAYLFLHVTSLATGGKPLPLGRPVLGGSLRIRTSARPTRARPA
jgi:succinate-acetate transporter protein